MTRGARWLPALILAAGACVPRAAVAPPETRAAAVSTREAFAIGDVRAARGTRASGWLAIPARGDSGTRIPISIVHGATAGPTLALVAGTQGGKVAPIVAMHRLLDQVDARTLRGTLIVVHVANMPAFHARSAYRGPWDGKNGNRVYPGRVDGSVTERIAATIVREVVRRSDYLIDLHAGEPAESLMPFTFAARPGLDARTDSLAREMAIAWGVPHIILDRDGPREVATAAYLQTTAHLLRVPALTTMAGERGAADSAAVRTHVEGSLQVMRRLGMLDGRVPGVRRIPPIAFYSGSDMVMSPSTGLWTPAVAPGDLVAAGALLGRLVDHFGAPLGDVRADVAGRVLYLLTTPAVSAGEPVVFLGVVAGEP